MATSGSSGRSASDSQSFDFCADDVRRFYEKYAAQNPSNGVLSDQAQKDYHESKKGGPLISIYDKEDYSKEDVMFAVENCMKKHADNLFRSLNGISDRLSQLEIRCQKLDQSIGEYRADIIRDHAEADQSFKTLEKHIQEVHKSVQIVRDKQGLEETHKELAKLQLAHKESSEVKENSVTQSAFQLKMSNDKPDLANQQLALALPLQAATPVIPAKASEQVQPYKEVPMHHQESISPIVQQDHYTVNQPGSYPQHSLPMQSDMQYVQPRSQDTTLQAPPQQPQTVTQNQTPSFPQHQQQCHSQRTQQLLQQAIQPQPPPHGQIRPQGSYPHYPPPSANAIPETFPDNSSIQGSYPVVPQPKRLHPESPFGYGGTGDSVSQTLNRHNVHWQTQTPVKQSAFGSQPSKNGYLGPGSYPPQYMQGYRDAYNYQPTNLQGVQNQQLPPSNNEIVHQLSPRSRSNPFGDMIEKAIGMGYPRDQVMCVVRTMAESRQTMDFNALLDRLNGQAQGW